MCTFVCQNADNFADHVRRSHWQEKFTCDHCKLQFDTWAKLDAHQRSMMHHSMLEEVSSKKTVLGSMAQRQSTGPAFICECGKKFYTAEALQAHRVMMTGLGPTEHRQPQSQREVNGVPPSDRPKCPHGMSSPSWCEDCQRPPLRERIIEGTPNYDIKGLYAIRVGGKKGSMYHPMVNEQDPDLFCTYCATQITPGQRFILTDYKNAYHVNCAMKFLESPEAVMDNDGE